ncbi:MAG: D-alanyl-D-alanine carboxypeptidase/D-alanyl-D-alanine-endopeptidase [Proteobacteria bacterium]|nr:D-alanyl-D-alanine carboxypeptidase/D-alanyl-D-alanine-endopeptidase [Pseudomonadota bacterium]
MGNAAIRGARVGVLVADLDTGQVLLQRRSGRALVPASNQKILTAAASLDVWGPAHRFETPVLIDGELADGVLRGSLWIRGSGDPGLVSESLWKLAEELRLLGLREVTGGIGVDRGLFETLRHHPDWHPLSRRAYHAPNGALAANYSSFRIEVEPGPRVGAPARLQVAPRTEYFRLRSDARTVEGRGRLQIGIQPLADGSGERVRIAGSVGRGAGPETYWRSVSMPERYAASLLREQLEAQGVRVYGGIRIGPAPASAREILRFSGDSLGNLVWKLNKNSNNFIAEQLFLLLGVERFGTPAGWDKSGRALAEWLERAGLADRRTVVADGSGLSPRNRISPRTLVGLIRGAALAPASGAEFQSSLPLGSLDGTLRDRRLESVPGIRGKTGHLRAASALSGVIPLGPERRLAFSVLVNGARGDRASVDAAIDGFVDSLAGSLGAARESAAANSAP